MIKTEEKNSFAIISQEYPTQSELTIAAIVGMKICREERILVTKGNELTNVFDVYGGKVASAKIENDILEIIPNKKRVSKVIYNHKDIIDEVPGSNNQTSISIKTEKGVILISGTRRKKIKTFVSKLPEVIAYCHPS